MDGRPIKGSGLEVIWLGGVEGQSIGVGEHVLRLRYKMKRRSCKPIVPDNMELPYVANNRCLHIHIAVLIALTLSRKPLYFLGSRTSMMTSAMDCISDSF